ncbi:MAG: ketoacyl-ACP synthase III [Cyclobacteriaceae bacterium]|nr:ketoacyl-ACP synthase III [Cyclobacteriaceae bacterium]
MMEAKIKAVSYYLPAKTLTNEELAIEFPDWSAEKIVRKLGITSRHIAGSDEFVSDLAVNAAESLFHESSIDRASVDFIILCTQSPDYFLPTTACIVQDRLGIPRTAGAIDINQGCSGFIYGLALAKGLVATGISKNVLLITTEIYSKHIHFSDKGNRAIFGDAAAAVVVSQTGFATIGEFDFGTDGSGAENLIVKNGAMRRERQSSAHNVVMDDYLFMDGSAIFNFTLANVPALVQQTLNKNNVTLEGVHYFVFHQANQFILQHLRKKIGISEERFLTFMQSCGNTVSSTIPIVLKEYLRLGAFKRNDQVLLAGFGVGYSWGATMITFTNEIGSN